MAYDTFDVFVEPFLPTRGRRYLSLQNIGNTHPACMFDNDGRPSGAFNVEGAPDPASLALIRHKATRMLPGAHGHTIAPLAGAHPADPTLVTLADRAVRRLRQRGIVSSSAAAVLQRLEPSLRDYSAYLLQTGLLLPKDPHNLLLVQNITDFDEILTKTAGARRVVVPYNPAPGFLELCRRYGVATRGQTSTAISRLNNKHYFRHWLRARSPELFSYPFGWYPAGTVPPVSELLDIMAYYPPTPGVAQDVLFVQTETGEAGRGNYRVTRQPDGGYIINGRRAPGGHLADTAALTEFISRLGAGVEVAPFLRLEASPSVGLVIGRDGVSCLGPFQQILNHNNDYRGFKLNRRGSMIGFTADVAAFLRGQLDGLYRLCLTIGQLQRSDGYLGYASIDTLVYRDPAGQIQLTLSEENLRYTGTCMLQTLVHGQPQLRARFLAGALSMMHHEAVPLSAAVYYRAGGSATGLARLLRSAGLPLAGPHASEGLVLMSQIYGYNGLPEIGLAAIAATDGRRDALFTRATQILGA